MVNKETEPTQATAPTENKIILLRGPKSWRVRYLGPQAQALRDLCGVNFLPTHISLETPAETVKAEIEKLNPGVIVEVREWQET